MNNVVERRLLPGTVVKLGIGQPENVWQASLLLYRAVGFLGDHRINDDCVGFVDPDDHCLVVASSPLKIMLLTSRGVMGWRAQDTFNVIEVVCTP